MKEEYKSQAGVERKYRVRGVIVFALLMLVCVGAMMLCALSFSTGNTLFGVSYIIAIILGLSYIVIKYNQLFVTYVAADDDNIILKYWDNHFFPYYAFMKIPLIRDFIPSRSEISEIPMDEISTIIIGTKSYVKRNAEDDEFNHAVAIYEKHKYSTITKALDKLNILYIKTSSGESCFMSIDQFNPSEVMETINRFTRFCGENVVVKINSRSYKKYLKRPENDNEE